MKRVIVIGGGFAGFSAVRYLSAFSRDLEVMLIDRKNTFDFLPLLPDTVGRGIAPGFLKYPLMNLSKRRGLDFIRAEVKSVVADRKIVVTAQAQLDYDYLIIASGSETNFYGDGRIRDSSYKLDSADDAQKIIRALEDPGIKSFIVSGGGYTGVEIATNIGMYFKKRFLEKRVVIVERASSLLGPLPEWMKAYVYENLKRLDIEVFPNTVVEKVEERAVTLSSKKVFNEAMLVWVAGVKTADFLQDLAAEKNPQGRLKVDEYLRIGENCFVAGDCAYVAHGDAYLRMAVQFAIMQGLCSAVNVVRCARGLALKRYRPLDLGYIIPMANNRSCGMVLGHNVSGMAATMLHFAMCIYRSQGMKNRWGIASGLLTGG